MVVSSDIEKVAIGISTHLTHWSNLAIMLNPSPNKGTTNPSNFLFNEKSM